MKKLCILMLMFLAFSIPSFAALEECHGLSQVIDGVPGPGNDCCPDLVRRGEKSDYNERCEWNGSLGNGGICLRCGDGQCDKALESQCNCPDDCGIQENR